MSSWPDDIREMHAKFGVRESVARMDPETRSRFLTFRENFLGEELQEMRSSENAEGKVDALIDLCVVAIGTLDAFGVDAQEAWDRVYRANMSKEVGVNPNRPNSFGLPDLIKPPGWVAPSHEGNHGILEVRDYD